jgi:formyl-CoA transferase/CoA:oxalate CoA-transferase
MLLADQGADVAKVERPGAGDDTRAFGPPFVNGQSAYFMSINRNKRSLVIDLKAPQGVDLVKRLSLKADVCLENFRPGKLATMGLGYGELAAVNPRLIYCSLSGFGQTGPWSRKPGYDLIVQGLGGTMGVTGPPEGPPYKMGTSIADLITGMLGFQGILLALLARERTGRGQHVDVAMLDAIQSVLAYQAGNYFAEGRIPRAMGNQHPSISPYETYRTSDGWVNVAVGNERFWKIFVRVIGREDLAEDERFGTNPRRVRHRDALNAVLEPILARRSAAEWVESLEAAGVPCGRILSVAESLGLEQTAAREMVVEMDHPVAGQVRATGIPIKLSDTPGSVRRPPPMLGQHTDQVLKEWLRMEPNELAHLRQNGVIQ